MSEVGGIGSKITFHLSKLWKVFHAVWCNISGEFPGEIWNWSLLGVKGLTSYRGWECIEEKGGSLGYLKLFWAKPSWKEISLHPCTSFYSKRQTTVRSFAIVRTWEKQPSSSTLAHPGTQDKEKVTSYVPGCLLSNFIPTVQDLTLTDNFSTYLLWLKLPW